MSTGKGLLALLAPNIVTAVAAIQQEVADQNSAKLARGSKNLVPREVPQSEVDANRILELIQANRLLQARYNEEERQRNQWQNAYLKKLADLKRAHEIISIQLAINGCVIAILIYGLLK